MATKSQDKTLGVITHILGIFTGFIGALIIYLVADNAFTKNEARKALNWQISALIYSIGAFILMFVLIGLILLPAIGIMNFIVSIIAAIKASDGKEWNYPLSIQFLK